MRQRGDGAHPAAQQRAPRSAPAATDVGGSYRVARRAADPGDALWRRATTLLGVGTSHGLADVPRDQPSPPFDAAAALTTIGTYISHVPNFNGFTYTIFGDRHWLDLMRWRGNADLRSRTGRVRSRSLGMPSP